MEGPSPVPEGQVPLPADYKPTLEAPFNPENPVKDKDGNLKLVWTGPWTIKDPKTGNDVALPRGNYTLTIKGTRKDRTEEIKSEPYKDVSLVEVTKVELLPDDKDPRGAAALSPNPPVANIEGQSPPQGRDYLDPNKVWEAGKRIFAEATTLILDTVKVRATVDPVIQDLHGQPFVTVIFSPMDVDDPALSVPSQPNPADIDFDINPLKVDDNRGSPKPGTMADRSMTVPAGAASVTTRFQVSLQPGDNYRIGVSTAEEWLGHLKAYQPSNVGEVRYDDGTTGGRVLTKDEMGAVSEMVTVWRTLHVSLDSIRAEPTSATASQRNFISGTIAGISEVTHLPGGRSMATRIDLLPDQTSPAVTLDDGSPNLDDGIDGGNGRFERGTLLIGSGPAAIEVQLLDGNGQTYVRKAAGIEIPFVLVDDRGNPVTPKGPPSSSPTVVGWDSASLRFTLNVAVAPSLSGGEIRIGGVAWSVVKAVGPFVDVREPQALPFTLRDDDASVAPFQLSSSLLTADVAEPDKNVFAQAYVQVLYDLPASNAAPFARNIRLTADHVAAKIQLDAGRQPIEPLLAWKPEYWTAYLQGGFQGDAFEFLSTSIVGDGDLDLEHDLAGTIFGETATPNERFGSLIYVEAMRDVAANRPALCGSLQAVMSETLPHEIGHQFGLAHDPAGTKISIMSQGCKLPQYFSAFALGEIRWKGAQR